jgi:Lrp/AsnC family transcriptional regulator
MTIPKECSDAEYLAMATRFTGPKLSLQMHTGWDIHPNMPGDIDTLDRRILAELQRDGTLSVDQLSERVSLSRNACWRRVKRLEEDGVITGRVALVDADKLGLGLSVFILIRTSNHDPDWLKRFREATTGFPEITGVYRMSGDLDYVLRARVADVKAYDRLYPRSRPPSSWRRSRRRPSFPSKSVEKPDRRLTFFGPSPIRMAS